MPSWKVDKVHLQNLYSIKLLHSRKAQKHVYAVRRVGDVHSRKAKNSMRIMWWHSNMRTWKAEIAVQIVWYITLYTWKMEVWV